MIYSRIFLHLADSWLEYDGTSLKEHQDWPVCSGPALTIDDFGNVPSGLHTQDGKSEYVSAIIERKVREQGLVDGESHVVIHQRLRVTGGQQILFSAVPVERWQRLQAWIGRQKDHCLVVPLLSQIAPRLKDGYGMVVCHGKQLTVLVRHDHRLTYLSGMAFSNSADDLKAALDTLAAQVGEKLRGVKLASMVWLSLYLSDAQAEADLVRSFSEISGVPLQMAPARTLPCPGGSDARIGVDYLLESFQGKHTVNSLASCMLAQAEMRMSWIMGVCVVLAVCMFVYGIHATVKAAIENGQAVALEQHARNESERAMTLTNGLHTPAEYPQLSSFIGRLDSLSSAFNPYSVLADIRQAAGKDARILRVSFDHGFKKTDAILVDGVLNDSSDVAQGITKFVTQLRQDGYVPTAIMPSQGNPSPAFFSYRLVRRAK